jgi:oxygen-dependent protoporphyrinogen oxidase
VSRYVVVGGGIAGLAAALRLERIDEAADIVLVERAPQLGGKLVTEHVGPFVVETAPDSFLTSKPRGVGLCEELGLTGELVSRIGANSRTFVRLGDELHPLPAGLTGMVPTNLDTLAASGILSADGLERMQREPEVPAAAGDADETIAAFVTRRMGREVYERLVEPLMSGIFAGDGEQLSLAATFPNLRQLEIEHGSVLRGLEARSAPGAAAPPFASLRGGMGDLVAAIEDRLTRTDVICGRDAVEVRPGVLSGWDVIVDDGEKLMPDAVVLATPAYVTAGLVASLDADLAAALAAIPYGSSVIVTLAYPETAVARSLDGYGYVVPRAEGSDVLACTWSSSKWEDRAPAGHALIRVYLGRFGRRDMTAESDQALLDAARREVAEMLGADGEPELTRIDRWPLGMPQYVLGTLERRAGIEQRLAGHPGLALAGAAYGGVGIPDCIASGENAAERVVVALAQAARR